MLCDYLMIDIREPGLSWLAAVPACLPYWKTNMQTASEHYVTLYIQWTLGADVLNAVYITQGLMCTIGLANELIDGGQPSAKNGF